MKSDPVLSIRAASKTFGSRRALDAVSLDVGRGEMIALIGPSGSGKSTLLRSIDGLQTIDAPAQEKGGEGTITAFGGPVQAKGKVSDQVRKARVRIGFIAQQFNLVGRLTLFTNVALGSLGRIGFARGLFGAWPAETRGAVMAALHRVGVADYAAQRANTLSGGQQQRGAIARALVQKAKIILADEPVASLDPVSARKVMEILRDLNKTDGLTVVVTLHQVDYALRYCARVVALKAGKKVYDGPTNGLGRDKLIDIYGPEFEDVFWEGAPQ
ncbi:phosphonate/organophosphate ester transporter subunit [Caulobacter sp. Root1455]|uniref:phosphonate ABC transporter ATP-binding protein n=1 Tax=Caulobacter sp. Root1455 TaxID=1736465 RepID=UPI0006FF6349|nr:phosphonate ABC transporter ATP-binding protein [Caulobacter sp. Root1455]KQY95861.1 phosphonate/organophosphate ester transporter subunit [Caulobacter sp. Root1455]